MQYNEALIYDFKLSGFIVVLNEKETNIEGKITWAYTENNL